MPQFITPYSGNAELTASNGLRVLEQGRWLFSQAGYNDGATFGLSLGAPYVKGYYESGQDTRDIGFNGGTGQHVSQVLDGGLLHLRAQDWTIAVIGNDLTAYTDPQTMITYPASQCRITVRGGWAVVRRQNSNSYNSFNITYQGRTETNQGDREMGPSLLTLIEPQVSYVIQGADVVGGAQDTFSHQEFWVRCTELCYSTNSNREFQSNTVIRPTWVYTYSKSWQIS